VDFGVSAQLDKTIGKRNTFIGTPYWYGTFTGFCAFRPVMDMNEYLWIYLVVFVSHALASSLALR